MEKQELYSIGQISKICKISVQTLRHYDKIDLLKPSVVNDDNGYRYYTHNQILLVKIIQQFKTMNFSLGEIGEIIGRNDLSLINRVLLQKKFEIKNQIEELQNIEGKLDAMVENVHFAAKENMESLVEIKKLPPRKVAYTRYRSPCYPDSFILRYNELQNIIAEKEFHIDGAFMAIFHDHYTVFDFNNADIEVCVEIKDQIKGSGIVRILPKGSYLSVLHKGSYAKTSEKYAYMIKWCEENGYEIIGKAIEIYIIDVFLTKNPDEYITELQFPVRKIR